MDYKTIELIKSPKKMASLVRPKQHAVSWVKGGESGAYLRSDNPVLGGWAAEAAVDALFADIDFSGDGNITASASGVTPPWIDGIGGAESWAVLQAAPRAMPGACRYKVHCEPRVNAVQVGMKVVAAASKSHTRVHALLLAALEDTLKDRVVWMPAHREPRKWERCGVGTGSC